MSEIKIIINKNINDFQNAINEHLKLGWNIQGGVCYCDGVFSIALIKKTINNN